MNNEPTKFEIIFHRIMLKCQKILSVWQQLGGKVEKLENFPDGLVEA
ncbi:MAG: hypothetical protein HC820_00855 [Hydrococcus sp. RM1_1_31]|nr:hypothetical protein [Hydrococcus sp. RM1_1_31]